MPEYRIGDDPFPSKAAAIAAVREILHTRPRNTPLIGADRELIGSLLGMHYDAETKIGAGVRHIEIRTPRFNHPGFVVVRTDGTAVSFSYKRCFDGESTARANTLIALRYAVEPDTLAFKRQTFHDARTKGRKLFCPMSGVELFEDSDTHVDHYGGDNEFRHLAEEFGARYGGLEDIESLAMRDGIRILADDVHDAWVEFHRARAQLRLLHRIPNIARYRRGA